MRTAHGGARHHPVRVQGQGALEALQRLLRAAQVVQGGAHVGRAGILPPEREDAALSGSIRLRSEATLGTLRTPLRK